MTKNKTEKSVLWIIIGILLFIYSVSLFLPMLWGLISSFKSSIDFTLNPFGMPRKWMFENYSTIIEYFKIDVMRTGGQWSVYIPEMILNSVLYALGSALIQAFIQFITAYAASRFDFKIGKVLYTIVILAMIVPIIGSDASALAVASFLGLRDSIIGMWVMKSYFLGMYFLVFYETLRAFPKDYAEAAYLDGAGNLSVMVRIMAPLSATTFFTITLLLFVQYWNDYTTPMLFMPNVPTLSYGLYYFSLHNTITEINTVPMKLGACMMMLVPTLIIFVAFHNKLLSNVTVGGVKE